MNDLIQQVLEIQMARNYCDIEIAFFGRDFSKGNDRQIFFQRLQAVQGKLMAQDTPLPIIAKLKTDLAVVELSLGDKFRSTRLLLEAVTDSVKASPDELFATSCLAWSILGYLLDRADNAEALLMSLCTKPIISLLENIRDELPKQDRLYLEISIAIVWLSLISVVADRKIFSFDPIDDKKKEYYFSLSQHAEKLDQWTSNRLAVREWLSSRLRIHQ